MFLTISVGANPAWAELATGSYTGDGSPIRTITGLGFQPAVVIVKGDLAQPSVIRVDYHTGQFSKQMTPPSESIEDGIIGFEADGFTIGQGPEVNDPGADYYWVAFSTDPGVLATDFYTGDGGPNHNILGVGFQPDVVLVIPHGNEAVQFRTIDMPDDFGTSFDGVGMYSNHLEYFFVDGFRVGSDPAVNGFGQQYGYVAFKADASKVANGWYLGDGSPGTDIGGLGLGPDYVIVKGFEATPGVQRTKSLGDPMSGNFWSEENLNNGIIDLKADHFRVGNNDRVNQMGRTYYYVAFNDLNGSADLEISQVVDDGTPDVGQELTFDIALFNNGGPDDATNAEVQVDLPAGLTYTGDTPGTGSYDNGTGMWYVGNLNRDNTETLRITATVDPGAEGQTLTVVSSVGSMDQSDPDGLDNTASTDLVVTDLPAADLALTASWDDTTPAEDQLVTLTVRMDNFGPDKADNITMVALLPAGLTFDTAWPDAGTYDPGTGEWVLPELWDNDWLVVDILATVDAEMAGTTLTVLPTITAVDQTDPDGSNNSTTAALTVTNADLQLGLSVDDPSPDEGQDITYYVDLVNNGPDDATDIKVDLTLPAGVTYQSDTLDSGSYNPGQSYWTIPSLAMGASTQLRVVYRINAGTHGQTLSTIADITEAGESDADTANNSAQVDVVVSSADLAVMIGVDDPAPDEDQQVVYTIGLQNLGPDGATGTEVSVNLPVGLTYVSDNTVSGTFNSGTGVWAIGPVADTGTAQLQITALVDAGTAGTTLTTTATVSAVDQADLDGSNNTAGVDVTVTSADLNLSVGVDDPAPLEGGQVVYTIDVGNLGPDDATGVDVSVTLPTGVTYVDDTPGTGTYNNGTGVWSVGPLPMSGAGQLQITASIDAGTSGSTLTTLAAVSASDQGDPNPLNNSGSADVFVGEALSADLGVAIAVDGPNALEAEQVIYTVDLTNRGPNDVTNARVTLALPAGLTYLSDFTGSGTYNSGSGVWTIGPLAVAGSAQLEVTASVDAGAAGSTLTTTASVSNSDLPDPDSLNNVASADVTILSSADLGLAAAFDNFNPLPGDATQLTVVLTNSGPNTASGIQVDLSLSADLGVDFVAPTHGNWDGGTLAWTIPSLAAGATDTLVLDLTVGAVPGGTELRGTAVMGGLTEIDPVGVNDTATATMIVLAPGEIRLVAEPFEDSSRSLLPGGPVADVLRLALINDSAFHETLQAITISNPVTGGFDQAAQDAAWKSLELWWEYGDKLSAIPGVEGNFAGGQLTFAGLDLAVKSGETLRLTVRGSASVTAPDGMILQPTINSGADLVFTNAVVLEGSWPLVAPGSLTVDGMTAAQITLHPVGAEIFQIGSVRNLALDVTLPSNGGVPDVLNKLNILNTGTALYPQVIDQMECWADNGDGLFNPAVDTWMAELRWTGGQRFEASALNQNVASAGLRVFVTVDIAEDALGGTLRLSLPAGDDLGVGMASGNDGPIDRSVTNPLAQTVSATDRVIVTTAPLSSRVVAPGESRLPILHLVARNLYPASRTILQLNLNNITVGDISASQADLDGTMSQLLVQMDGDGDGELDGPEIDPVVVSTTWEDGTATFDGLGWTLAPDEVSHLFITASIDLLGAANGDMIGAVVGSALDVEFSELTAVVGAWPLDSGGRYEVDGMVAAQVANPAVPPVSLTANEGPVLALDITVPGNGYLDDTLQTLRLANLGTAIPTDINALALYDDQDGNGIFEPGTDPWLADFTGIGQDWVALDVALAIPAAGRRLFAGLTVASTPTDSATVRLAVPVDGLDMASRNDGPRDAAVESPTSLLMSTAPLLSNLSFGYDYSTTEMSVTVTMNVKNVGGEDVVNITPRDLAVTGDGGMTLFSGPLPASLDLVQGAEGTFTWVFDGQSQGPVFVAAWCEGTGAVGGQPRGSLASGSAAHIVLDPALDLDLYPVANMPFSINRGQTGVVPMTLTLLNPGGPDRANLRLEQLVVTLDDGDGNPVVPADLLAHVTINEGANVFCDRSSLETTGQTMTLDLDPPVVVTDSEPVTLGLRLDILTDTTVDRFRVILMDPADLTVVDHVSHLPRTVNLSNGNFPVMSAAGSIVSQATGLVVSAPVQPDLTAGSGQEDVSLLRLELTGSGGDASEVKVGGFAVMVVDTLGQALPDASAYLSRLWVEGPLGTNAAYDLDGPADSLVVFEMLPQVTVPVGAEPVALTVHGRMSLDPILGPLHLRLEPTDTFDARDGNNSADVLVTYQPAEITGPRVTIQEPAPAMLVAVHGELPPVVSLGAGDVLAMTVNLAHPGPVTSAAVRLDTMRLDFLDINRQPQDPDAILDGYRVQWQGVDLSVPVFYENQQIVIPLGGRLLDPFTQGDLVLRVDIEADAPGEGFEMVLSPTGILASDNNLGLPIDLVAATGYSLPAGSNVAQLQPPSEDVVAGWLDRMPPLLPTDEVRVEAMRLVLTNPAPAGAAPVELSSLVLRAADRHGLALAAGTMLSGVEVEYEGSVWAEISSPTLTDSTLTLTGSVPLTLRPGIAVAVVIKVSGRADVGGDGLSIGLLDGDVLCTQPGSTTPVAVRPAAGETFPFWTAAAGLGKAALADSYINFPNPFAAGREQTSFAFNLDQPATVSLCIWTPRGESVTTLLQNKALAAGLYQDLVWDGRNGGGQAVRNGVYLAELKVQYEGGGSERLLRKVAVVR